MSRLQLIALVALAAAVRGKYATHFSQPNGICDSKYCDCIEALHPAWKTINCTLPSDAKLDIFSLDLPRTVTELTIKGAEAVMFGPGAFNNVADIRQIDISDSKIVLFQQFSAMDINIVNLSLNIRNCDVLRFEKQSFTKLRGPMSVKIANCAAVSVEGETFSWLLDLDISNVPMLTLGKGAFSLDPTAANVGDHGPGMSVELRNTKIEEISKSTFGSSAAKVYLERVNISAICTGAFSANTYNVVAAINCSIRLIEEEAFSQNSLINYLKLDGCDIQYMSSKAMRSAISDIWIQHSRFDHIDTGAINTTVATVKIKNNEFHEFMEKGFELSEWNVLQMENNSFDDLPPNAIAAPGASIHKLIFKNNEIETLHANSLSFIGKAATQEIEYLNNYYGQTCHCNISRWLAQALGVEDATAYATHSYCTVNEVLARCFNVPDQNMMVNKFIKEVCIESKLIKCEQLKSKSGGEIIEIKNPRFPHKGKNEELTARNKKVIGIVIVSCLGCILISIMFSLYKWWKRSTGGCANVKAMFISLNTSCGSVCGRICRCDSNIGIDNARSISHMSINEYSERHRLNESRAQDIMQESSFRDEVVVPRDDKYTQTLPEELTKELLDNLKERLDNPENYVEAREMIEHLYELTKITENASQNPNTSTSANAHNTQENIYELPFQNTTRRVGPNDLQMVSVGTRIPSLDKLTPLSPYYRETALSHGYFEPKDLAVHLYAEIANDLVKKTKLGAMPDVIAEQPFPRGPYLRAVLVPNNTPNSSPAKSSSSSNTSPIHVSSIKSDSSNTPGKMVNRPLPEKPQGGHYRPELGEGSSFNLG